MYDVTQHTDFELYRVKGKLPPDPDNEDYDPNLTVPPLIGMADHIKALTKGEQLCVNVPDAAKRSVAQRMDSAHRKVQRGFPERSYSVTHSWFGVVLTRVS